MLNLPQPLLFSKVSFILKLPFPHLISVILLLLLQLLVLPLLLPLPLPGLLRLLLPLCLERVLVPCLGLQHLLLPVFPYLVKHYVLVLLLLIHRRNICLDIAKNALALLLLLPLLGSLSRVRLNDLLIQQTLELLLALEHLVRLSRVSLKASTHHHVVHRSPLVRRPALEARHVLEGVGDDECYLIVRLAPHFVLDVVQDILSHPVHVHKPVNLALHQPLRLTIRDPRVILAQQLLHQRCPQLLLPRRVHPSPPPTTLHGHA
mmetsp:Transcript_7586/g.17369  ORF Transcript_7586/g.17369 Transcript_7586/m.17369 type:complete len:262 (-) Transcript_7586:183-968(-)